MDKRIAPTARNNPAGPDRHARAALPAGPLVAMAMAVALSWASSGANAAALGAATVQSALGEPLRAEIQIPQLSSEEASTFSARMAPPSAFAGAGISYNTNLANARVSLERRANGQAYLRITTDRPINEPVLSIVIEADWASGQVTRDYTMLLDPPKRMEAGEAVQETAAAASARSPTPAAATAPQPPRVGRAEQVRPAKTAAARERSTPPQAERAPAPHTRSGSLTVRSGDTASQIAVAHGLQGVSLDQMLLAMLRANPNAFIRGNVNLIRAGAVLQMPSAEDARTVSRAEARRRVVAQTDDFQAYRSGLARNVQATQAAPGSQSAEGPVEPQVAEAQEAPAEEDRLEISKGGTGAGDATQAAQSRQISDQVERVAELDRNISELSELEKQLDGATTDAGDATAPDAQDSASSAEGEDVQAMTAQEPAGADDASAQPPAEDAAADAAAPADDASGADVADAEEAATPAADEAQEAAAAGDAPAATAEGEDTDAAQPAPLATAAAAPADGSGTASQDSNLAIPASLPAEQPASMLDRIAEYRWPIVAILVALLALLGLGRSRRRKADEPLFDDGPGTDSPFVNVGAAAPAAGTAAAGAEDEEQTGLLTPDATDDEAEEEEDPEILAQRLAGAFANTAFPLTATETDSGAVSDLVAEADIYVEYGHDEKAEELLQQALRAEPGRTEIYGKLAAIYLRRSDREALMELSARAAAAPAHAETAWQAVAAAGRELEPSNPRYQPSASAAAPAAGDTADELPLEALDELQPTRAALDQPFNHQVFWAETEKGGAELESDETEGEDHRYSPTTLDFDLDFEETTSLQREAPTPPAAELTADDLRKPDDGAPQPMEHTPGTHEESLDLEIDFSASERAGGPADDPRAGAGDDADGATAGPAPAAESTLMDFDLDTLSTQGMQRAADSTLMDFDLGADAASETAPDAASTFIDFDLDDPGTDTEAPAAAATHGNDDPLATKLALAEEFAAIGDSEGARSMAHDVAQSATGALKEKADAFIKQLGGKP